MLNLDVNARMPIIKCRCKFRNARKCQDSITSIMFPPPLATNPLLSSRSCPRYKRSSILPCISLFCCGRQGIKSNTLVDLPTRNVTILQAFDMGKDLVRRREIRAGRASDETGRAREANAKDAEVGARGKCEAGLNSALGIAAGMSLSIAEGSVRANIHLLAARNHNVCRKVSFWSVRAGRKGKNQRMNGVNSPIEAVPGCAASPKTEMTVSFPGGQSEEGVRGQ